MRHAFGTCTTARVQNCGLVRETNYWQFTVLERRMRGERVGTCVKIYTWMSC